MTVSIALITECSEDDLTELAKIAADAALYHHERSPELFRAEVDLSREAQQLREAIAAADRNVWVAKGEEHVLGFVIATFAEKSREPAQFDIRHCYVNLVAVAAKSRSRGIGKALMREVEQEALTRGMKEMRLGVWDFNDPAKALYSQRGYVPRVTYLAKTLAKEL